MPKWLVNCLAAVMIIMAFAMMASTWSWLMGLSPAPGGDILFGRAMLGCVLSGAAAMMICGFHV